MARDRVLQKGVSVCVCYRVRSKREERKEALSHSGVLPLWEAVVALSKGTQWSINSQYQ